MLNYIKASFTQKFFFPLWGLLVVFILLDITTRLINYETKDNSQWKLKSISKETILTLQAEQVASIIKMLNNYQTTPEIHTHTHQTMSEAEQLAQQGSLNQLYAGNIRYRLVGIFDKNEPFAVIQQLDVLTNEQNLVKVNVLERLKNYKVTKIFPDNVTLKSDNNGKITLFLYKNLGKSN
ncbi:MAG: hypothetical protein ACI9VT_001544 [Psychroserpens sp.]|jgi:hypothetical protein